ncbi:hypothetical protein F6X40_34725 [Paraburkholderia sp. UCT31]|uniref:hypothetical protein n=1 Tax=Paraburkholderia sp. UCT31 TaxID=2615209 RepID=UPI001655D68F|nr:hypothetical protein [Paraburkholderia sp. UCT31]MBC8741717.1 hypothetical protein [Paraburkholderia sp. UCT31]
MELREFKENVKSTVDFLERKGFTVPHSAMLEAASKLLGERDFSSMRNLLEEHSKQVDARISAAAAVQPAGPNSFDAEKARSVVLGLLEAMEMQERRETGEFHLTVQAARAIWDAAKAKGAVFLGTTPRAAEAKQQPSADSVPDPMQVADVARLFHYSAEKTGLPATSWSPELVGVKPGQHPEDAVREAFTRRTGLEASTGVKFYWSCANERIVGPFSVNVDGKPGEVMLSFAAAYSRADEVFAAQRGATAEVTVMSVSNGARLAAFRKEQRLLGRFVSVWEDGHEASSSASLDLNDGTVHVLRTADEEASESDDSVQEFFEMEDADGDDFRFVVRFGADGRRYVERDRLQFARNLLAAGQK